MAATTPTTSTSRTTTTTTTTKQPAIRQDAGFHNVTEAQKIQSDKIVKAFVRTIRSAIIEGTTPQTPTMDVMYVKSVHESLQSKYGITVAQNGTLAWPQDHPKLNTVGTAVCNSRNANRYCDFTITCNDKKYPCHKSVLASKSPYFSKKFDKQQISSEMSVDDLIISATHIGDSSNIIKLFLDYLYGINKDFSDLEVSTLIPLWILAEKFQLPYLASLCQKNFEKNLDSNSFPAIAKTAAQQNSIPPKLAHILEKFAEKEIARLAQTGGLENVNGEFLETAKNLKLIEVIYKLRQHSSDPAFKRNCQKAIVALDSET